MSEREQNTAVPFGAPPVDEAAPEPVENLAATGEVPVAPGTGEVVDAEPVAPQDVPGTPEAAAASAEASAEGTGHEQVERDLDELAARAEKADEYLALAQRTRADFDNFRKRASRDAALAQERGIAKLAKELLPAIDNLDRAVAHVDSASEASPADEQLVTGVKLVHTELLAALGRAGIVPFSPQGESFDPNLHEAVAQVPKEGIEAGTVIEVYQQGYRLGEAVLRPARVLVSA